MSDGMIALLVAEGSLPPLEDVFLHPYLFSL